MKYFYIVISMFLATSALAQDFEHTETNWFVKHNDFTVGTRQNIDLDVQHYILRKDFKDTPYRLEYRYVDKGDKYEHWLRGQIKQFSYKGLWYNHRIEHRIREDKDNVLRYRPQFGYKHKMGNIVPFITFEPHWQYNYTTEEAGYSHLQTFTGIEYKMNKLTVAPFIEVDFDKNFDKDTAFVGVDIKYSF